jgi:prepilin-type N-terminal cleavage/methylation domain-containing protein
MFSSFITINHQENTLPLYEKNGQGFTLIEVLVYIVIVSIVLLLVSAFIFYFIQSNEEARADREVLENARRVLEEVTYEIQGAKGVYTPTTGTNQLSLETARYLPAGETTTYIDFFVCGTRICLKKESQNPIYLTSDSVQVASLTFTQVVTNGAVSIKTTVALQSKEMIKNVQPSVSVTSTAALRNNE